MTERGHQFIEVGRRRWCVRCDLFQARSSTTKRFAEPLCWCANDTPYAKAHPVIVDGEQRKT